MSRPLGTARIVGMVPEGQRIEINAAALLSDRRLIGSNMGSNAFRIDMPRFVDFYMQGKLELDELISKGVPLEMINEAYTERGTAWDVANVALLLASEEANFTKPSINKRTLLNCHDENT